MDVIDRESARTQGLKTYFTGKPCNRGHVVERRIHNRVCIECENRSRIDYHKNYRIRKVDHRRTQGIEYRTRDVKKYAANQRAQHFTEKGTVSHLLTQCRIRARKRNIPFDLDRDFIAAKVRSGICEVSGLSLEIVSSAGCRVHPFKPSIDRIKPELGYVKSNVRIVCWAVNAALADWGDEILLKVARAIVEKFRSAAKSED